MRWDAMGARLDSERTREVGREGGWEATPRRGASVLAVVAEKPAVARDIARALGASQRGEGWFRGNGYVVTWAIGHLVGLAQPHEIRPDWKRWSREQLPMLPREWPLMVAEGTRSQFSVVREVMNAPEVAAVVKDVLVGAGHTVDTAISGRDALQMIEVTPYDLVFTDLGMPDMSGWEVAEKINDSRTGIQVALVTGWGTSLDESDAKRRGVEAVVHKPFEIDELVRIAHRLLIRSGAGATN